MIKIIFKHHNIYVNDNKKVLCSEDNSYEKMEVKTEVSYHQQFRRGTWKYDCVFKLKTAYGKPIRKRNLEAFWTQRLNSFKILNKTKPFKSS